MEIDNNTNNNDSRLTAPRPRRAPTPQTQQQTPQLTTHTNTGPASRTRAQTAEAMAAPPAMNTRSRVLLHDAPPSSAAAVMDRMRQKQHHRLYQQLTRVENEVHEALAVMDAASRK